MFKQRSSQSEFLDADEIPSEELYRNLRELDFINTWLGGHAISCRAIEKMLIKIHLNSLAAVAPVIADVGCGGGDNLKAIAQWARNKKIKVKLIGIDLKRDCIDFAAENCRHFPEISFIHSDYRLVDQDFDIIMSALFCHHLNDRQMVDYLNWCEKRATKGFFINDLQRHPLAYYSIKFLTSLFSKSYLVKNDAPLSVLRGFFKSELENYLKLSDVKKYSIRWMWAFRYLTIRLKDE